MGVGWSVLRLSGFCSSSLGYEQTKGYLQKKAGIAFFVYTLFEKKINQSVRVLNPPILHPLVTVISNVLLSGGTSRVVGMIFAAKYVML